MLYIFDLDGTLISGYMDNPDRDFDNWQVLPGRQETIARLVHLGHDVAIATNQAGVAFGHTMEQDVVRKLGRVAMALGFASVWIFDGGQGYRAGWDAPALHAFVSYGDARSRDRRYQDASRRKPSGAMIREAIAEFPAAAADDVLFVGDRPEDQAAATDAGVRFEWAERFFHGR